MSNEDKTDAELAAEEQAASDVSGDEDAGAAPDVTTNGGDAEAAQAVPPGAAEPDVSVQEPEVAAAAKSSRGGGIAWLALFLALIGVAAVGYSLMQDWRARQSAEAGSERLVASVAELGGRLDDSEGAVRDLNRRIAELTDANAGMATEIDRLGDQIDQRLGMLDSLPPRMTSLEASLAALQGVSAGARETWLIAEAEYYMQIANSQLQLAGNPELALIALRMADERILQLSNPALIDVRRTLSDELAALEAMEKPDIEGATLTLASLARVVDSLPLRRASTADGTEPGTADEAASGVDRVWSSIKGAFSELVKVTPADRAEMPLIAPEAEYFLRTNLTLQLQAARLALLRGERAVFEQSLDDAAAWLHEHFDRQSAQVTSAMQTISEIRQGVITVAAPDISQSLKLLRQYKILTETEQ